MPQLDHVPDLGVANGIAQLDAGTLVPLAQLPGSAGRQDNLSAIVDPTVNDDATGGYAVGSVWINVAADTQWICLDSTATAAVWKDVTNGGSTLIIKDENTNIANTPHSALDFAGAGVTVTDAGGGVALVTVPGITEADMAGVQARRTTTLAVPATWTDVTFDATDVENDAAVVEHDNTNTDRIILHEAGLYQITYSIVSDLSNASVLEARIRVNDTTVLEAAEGTVDLNTNNSIGILFDQVLYIATAADFISLQIQDTTTSADIRTHMSLAVVRLKGQKGDPGATGAGSTVIVKDENVNVANTPHSALDFAGAGVTVTDAGSGVALVTIPGGGTKICTYLADNLDSPINADWTVNALAPAAADSNNAALIVRLFDDTTEEGVGFSINVPSTATNLIIRLKSRAEVGAANNVIPKLYNRDIPDNGAVTAWSAGTALTAVAMTVNENFQYDEETIALATLGATVGELVQFELTRDAAAGGDTLVGDWALLQVEVTFS